MCFVPGNILLREDVIPQNDETNDDVNIDYSSINHDSSSDSFLSTSMRDDSNDVNKLSKMDSETAMDVCQSDKTSNLYDTQPNKKRKSSFNADDDCNSSDSVCSHLSDGSIANGEPKLVLIDYEYCSYNHRGFDLANHFIEWAYEYTKADHPFYYERFEQYPTLEQKVINLFSFRTGITPSFSHSVTFFYDFLSYRYSSNCKIGKNNYSRLIVRRLILFYFYFSFESLIHHHNFRLV